MSESESPQARRAPTADPLEPDQRVGTTIDGRYRLTELIGQGGMGAVYRGEHTTIRRPVAVKLLHSQLVQVPELARRFEREAYAVGRIDHPNCVNVSDFGRLADGSLFLVMEYLEGETLGDRLDRDGRLPPERALRVLRHVVSGLGHAHRAGIVHRDVKPDNVILVEHGGDPDFAKVLDFGIAKVIGATDGHHDDKLTAAGIAFGTPTYLSPEQAVGDEAGPAADLYSATVMFYEMLTGKPPFHSADKLELLAMHASKEPPPLWERLPQVALPAEVEDLIASGLAKRPARRFPDADTYLTAIDRAITALGSTPPPRALTGDPFTPPPDLRTPTPVPPITEVVSPAPRRKRPPRGALVGGGLAVVAVAIIAALATSAGEPEPEGWELPEVTEASRAAEASLSRGAPDETIEILGRDPATIAGDAQAQLQLGHAHASRSDYDQAIEAYRKALALEPSLVHDAALRANLELMSDDDGPVLVEAVGLLIVFGDDDAARTRLVELTTSEDAAVRRQALPLAEALGVGDRVDRVAVFTLDLRRGKSCEERREAVAKLRALGDPRAIPALEKARKRPAGSRWRRYNANACLKQQAEDAVKYLRSLSRDAGPR